MQLLNDTNIQLGIKKGELKQRINSETTQPSSYLTIQLSNSVTMLLCNLSTTHSSLKPTSYEIPLSGMS